MMRQMLSQRLHVSWLIAVVSVGMVIGVVAVQWAPYGYCAHWPWLVSGLVLLPFLVKQQRWVIVLALMAGLLLGLWRGSVGQVGLEQYQQLMEQTVQVTGRVLEDPDVDKRGQTLLRLANIQVQGRNLPGKLWVVTAKNQAIKRSDIVTVQGKMSEGFAAFAGRMSRAKVVKVERPTPGDVAVAVRDWFAERVRGHSSESTAALGMGFLTGLRRALPAELNEALQIAGLTHVIVASGYNLTILVRLSRRLFVKVSKYLATLSATAMILSFMALTGMSPSMSRAGLVAGLSLAVWYYGRQIHPLVLLPFAAAITLLIDPSYAWGDLGWQLSFAAFAGVMLLAPLLQRYFFGKKPPGTLRQIFGETLSAQIMTLPLLMLAFGTVSNVALLANMLILPLIPLAMLLTFVVGVVSGVPLIAPLIAAPTEWLLQYMIAVAQWLAAQSWAQTEVAMTWWQMVLLYGMIALAMHWMRRRTGFDYRTTNIVA